MTDTISLLPMIPAALPPEHAPGQRIPADDATLRGAAKAFEAAFLSEMLKHAGVGERRGPFGGGPGEAAFSDLLVREYATEIARTGRIGLQQHVYANLKTRAQG